MIQIRTGATASMSFYVSDANNDPVSGLGLSDFSLDIYKGGIHKTTPAETTITETVSGHYTLAVPFYESWGIGDFFVCISSPTYNPTGWTEDIQVVSAGLEDIAAIKNKTDNLPSSPAAVGSAMTLTASYDPAKSAASASVLADVKTKVDSISSSGTSGGTGSVIVTAEYGATGQDLHPLGLLDGAAWVAEAIVTAYVKSEWAANPMTATARGWTRTKDDGTWEWPLALDHGVAYTLVYKRPGYDLATVNLTIP